MCRWVLLEVSDEEGWLYMVDGVGQVHHRIEVKVQGRPKSIYKEQTISSSVMVHNAQAYCESCFGWHERDVSFKTQAWSLPPGHGQVQSTRIEMGIVKRRSLSSGVRERERKRKRKVNKRREGRKGRKKDNLYNRVKEEKSGKRQKTQKFIVRL